METIISLVRHGVTDWNYAGRVQGRSDIPLAPEGQRQAEAAAERLAGEWDGIYSSPLQRAYELETLLFRQETRATSLEPVIWKATAIEAARAHDKLVGFARAFTDGLLYGCIDIAVVLPGYEHVRPVLIHRLTGRYPEVQFTIIPPG